MNTDTARRELGYTVREFVEAHGWDHSFNGTKWRKVAKAAMRWFDAYTSARLDHHFLVEDVAKMIACSKCGADPKKKCIQDDRPKQLMHEERLDDALSITEHIRDELIFYPKED